MTGHSELNCPQTDTEDDHPIPSQRGGGCSTITEEGKSARVENISAKLVQACAEEVITALKLQQDLADKRMANPLNPVLGSHTSQERQPAAVSKLLNSQPQQPLKKSHAEDHTEQTEAASGEDHCWRTGRLQSRKEHHRDLQPEHPLWEISQAPARSLPCLHKLKKDFSRVCHAALWATMTKYNISATLIRVIKHLTDKATSAVLFNCSIGNWFRTMTGVRQGCLLSPTLFDIFLEGMTP